MSDVAWASASAIAAAVARGEVSATTVVEPTLARIAQLNPVLNAFTAVTAERARARAAAIDATCRRQGHGPLAGVPFAVKNLIDIAGLPTLAGSKINRDHPPATADAPLVSRLEAAGAVLVGALNMGEYAYDFTGENMPRRSVAQSARHRANDRRFVRRIRRRGRPAAWCRSRSARTPTVRSACRRRSAACSG